MRSAGDTGGNAALLEPVVAMAVAWLRLRKALTPVHVGGARVVLAGSRPPS